jgi:hypothetical protein
MVHYKIEKWVQLNKNHKRQYIFVVKNMEEANQYWYSKGNISTKVTVISGFKYWFMKIFYNCYKKEYWEDQEKYF